mmetsp:Transcript_52260/g.144721  ORF Transcript_52260/g.144721 Transcript_52260/m.144721 type:complete len:286 (+) Transcript_52260:356-1213(+)
MARATTPTPQHSGCPLPQSSATTSSWTPPLALWPWPHRRRCGPAAGLEPPQSLGDEPLELSRFLVVVEALCQREVAMGERPLAQCAMRSAAHSVGLAAVGVGLQCRRAIADSCLRPPLREEQLAPPRVHQSARGSSEDGLGEALEGRLGLASRQRLLRRLLGPCAGLHFLRAGFCLATGCQWRRGLGLSGDSPKVGFLIRICHAHLGRTLTIAEVHKVDLQRTLCRCRHRWACAKAGDKLAEGVELGSQGQGWEHAQLLSCNSKRSNILGLHRAGCLPDRRVSDR